MAAATSTSDMATHIKTASGAKASTSALHSYSPSGSGTTEVLLPPKPQPKTPTGTSKECDWKDGEYSNTLTIKFLYTYADPLLNIAAKG